MAEQELDESSSFDSDDESDQEDNDDRVLMRTMLETLGFEKRYIEKAIRMYEKSYGAEQYNPDDITQIILRLQEKEAIKKQKQQLLAMNLEPRLADEIFGKGKYPKQKKSKAKTAGFHSGDIVQYRHEIRAQILDKMDEYLQICWPTSKPLYQRAILWVHFSEVRTDKDKKDSKNKGSFFGMIGLKSDSAKQAKADSANIKYQYKFEKLWRDITVEQFECDSNAQFSDNHNCESKSDPKSESVQIMKIEGSALKSEFMKESKNKNNNKFEIVSVYEISNKAQQILYNKRKSVITQFGLDSNATEINESRLWYPLQRSQVFRIISHGFKRKYGQLHSFGFGHKFYKNAQNGLSKHKGSLRHSRQGSDSVEYVLHCAVICGQSCQGMLNMKVPRVKPNKSYILYETCVDSLQSSQSWQIYQDYQALPLHILCIKGTKDTQKKEKARLKRRSEYKKKQSFTDFQNSKIFMEHFGGQSQQQQRNAQLAAMQQAMQQQMQQQNMGNNQPRLQQQHYMGGYVPQPLPPNINNLNMGGGPPPPMPNNMNMGGPPPMPAPLPNNMGPPPNIGYGQQPQQAPPVPAPQQQQQQRPPLHQRRHRQNRPQRYRQFHGFNPNQPPQPQPQQQQQQQNEANNQNQNNNQQQQQQQQQEPNFEDV